MTTRRPPITDTKQCAYCGRWIPSPHGRRELDAHIRICPERYPAEIQAVMDHSAPLATVKRATLFDGVADSFQSEGELNGWRLTQANLFEHGEAQAKLRQWNA